MKALSVRQPWAWLLFHGKPVENRDWPSSYRGPLLIHASKGGTLAEYQDAILFVESFDERLASTIPPFEMLARGAIVGQVEMIGCVSRHTSMFFLGKWGFLFKDARELSVPVPQTGKQGFFEVEVPNGPTNQH